MPAITLADLKAQLRSGEFDRLYFIYGNESYLKRCYMERLLQKCVDKAF